MIDQRTANRRMTTIAVASTGCIPATV